MPQLSKAVASPLPKLHGLRTFFPGLAGSVAFDSMVYTSRGRTAVQ